MKIRVFYHGNCPDGFTAAWVASQHLPDDAVYTECFYDKPFAAELAELGDATVLFLDFSPSREVLLAICEVAEEVLVLDHHKTARDTLTGIENPPKNLKICFDMNRCGAMITWDYFHNPSYVPISAVLVGEWEKSLQVIPPNRNAFVEYIQDRDLWTWKLEGSRQVSAWISSWPQTFTDWDKIDTRIAVDLDAVILEGEAIERFQQRRVEAVIKNSWMETIQGPNGTMYVVPCCNASSHISEIGEALNAACPDAPFTMTWFQKGDKKIYSLRVRKGSIFDASAIAKHHGGGGHPAACGFTRSI